MSFITSFQIASYQTGVGWGGMGTSPGAEYPPRYVTLFDAAGGPQVSLFFHPEPSALPAPTHNGWHMRTGDYGDVHRLLQTEQPLFVELAWDTGAPTAPLLGVWIGTTQPEPPGEGPADPRQLFASRQPFAFLLPLDG